MSHSSLISPVSHYNDEEDDDDLGNKIEDAVNVHDLCFSKCCIHRGIVRRVGTLAILLMHWQTIQNQPNSRL